jgi:hypothetical protein
MKKFFVKKENLNEEELRSGKVSYKRIVDKYIDDLVLCNKISKVDYSIWENIKTPIDEDEEIYQYFLCDLNSYDVDSLEELGNPLILSYSDKLECDVLMVDHLGTSWAYVMTDVEWTENFDEC